MKPSFISLFAVLAATSPLFATVTINAEFGQLRNSDGIVIATTTTLYAIVYDTDNNSSLPGGLGVNQSLTGSGSVSAFGSFAGRTLSQGLTIGGDTVVKFGTFNDPDGFTNPVLLTSDFIASGLTEASGRNYAIYWFPGVSTSTIPINAFEVGAINETVDYFGSGSNFIGTVIPTDGATVTTSILDDDLGGEISNTLRFTAIKTTPTFYWDTDTATPGAQGGTGNWNNAATNWNTGSSNYGWTGTDNDAIFGGTAGTVTITSTIAANDLTFNTTGYTVTGGTLTLNGTTPTVTTAPGVSATLSSQIQGSSGLRKAGSGTLTLGGTNSYTGATTIQSGVLVIDGSTSTGSVVDVEAGGKLAGSGTVGGDTTVKAGGKYSAGAVGAVGHQTFSNDLNLQSGSIFEWDLTSASTTSGFDTVTVNTGGILTGSGAFQVVTDLDFSNAFWTQQRTWATIFDGTGTLTGWSSSMANVYNSAGTLRDVAVYGSFTISGSTLTWAAVPEISNVLIGGLLGLGLLRRRREV